MKGLNFLLIYRSGNRRGRIGWARSLGDPEYLAGLCQQRRQGGRRRNGWARIGRWCQWRRRRSHIEGSRWPRLLGARRRRRRSLGLGTPGGRGADQCRQDGCGQQPHFSAHRSSPGSSRAAKFTHIAIRRTDRRADHDLDVGTQPPGLGGQILDLLTAAGAGREQHDAPASANIQDRDGAVLVIEAIHQLFPWLRHLFADSVYNGPNLNAALTKFATGPSRSLNARLRRPAFNCCRVAGSSSEPSPGSIATAGWQRISRHRSRAPGRGFTSPRCSSSSGDWPDPCTMFLRYNTTITIKISDTKSDDSMQQRFAGAQAPAVLANDRQAALECLGGEPSEMRRDDDILQLEQGVVFADRLAGKYIETSTA